MKTESDLPNPKDLPDPVYPPCFDRLIKRFDEREAVREKFAAMHRREGVEPYPTTCISMADEIVIQLLDTFDLAKRTTAAVTPLPCGPTHFGDLPDPTTLIDTLRWIRRLVLHIDDAIQLAGNETGASTVRPGDIDRHFAGIGKAETHGPAPGAPK